MVSFWFCCIGNLWDTRNCYGNIWEHGIWRGRFCIFLFIFLCFIYFCYSIVYWIIHIVFEPSCGLVVQLLICTVYPIPLGLTLCWWSSSTLEIYSDQLIITIWFQVLILRSAYYDFMTLIICLMISKMDYATGSLHH